jgi:hypothetical protein
MSTVDPQPASPTDRDAALKIAQLEQVQLENEKLKLELQDLRRGPSIAGKIGGQLIPAITTLLAIGTFWWGIHQYSNEQKDNRATAEREFMKPWLENQREIYMRALNAAAVLATTDDVAKHAEAQAEFWRLYYGKMVVVETTHVSGAMKEFGAGLTSHLQKDEMSKRSLALGSVMAESMAATARMTFREFADNQFKYKSGE